MEKICCVMLQICLCIGETSGGLNQILSNCPGGEALSTLGRLRIVRQWKEYLKDLLSPTNVYSKQEPELRGWRELSHHMGRGC